MKSEFGRGDAFKEQDAYLTRSGNGAKLFILR